MITTLLIPSMMLRQTGRRESAESALHAFPTDSTRFGHKNIAYLQAVEMMSLSSIMQRQCRLGVWTQLMLKLVRIMELIKHYLAALHIPFSFFNHFLRTMFFSWAKAELTSFSWSSWLTCGRLLLMISRRQMMYPSQSSYSLKIQLQEATSSWVRAQTKLMSALDNY